MAVKVTLKYKIMHKMQYPIEVELVVSHYPQYESHPRNTAAAIDFESNLPEYSTIEYLGMQMGDRYIKSDTDMKSITNWELGITRREIPVFAGMTEIGLRD